MNQDGTLRDEGLWRRDPEAFLRVRYGWLVDRIGITHEAAAMAVLTLAQLAGLPEPELVVLDAVQEWERQHPESEVAP